MSDVEKWSGTEKTGVEEGEEGSKSREECEGAGEMGKTEGGMTLEVGLGGAGACDGAPVERP